MRTALSFLLIAIILLSLAIMNSAGGWSFLFVGIFVFPIFLLVHCIIHAQAISKRPWITAILVSHTLLLAGFLLWVDAGDSSSFVIAEVIARDLGLGLQAPDWMRGPRGRMLDLFLFVLVAVSWLFVYPQSDPKLAGRILVAIFLPWLHFYTVQRPVAAIISLGLVLTTTGWIPASIWALYSLIRTKADQHAKPPNAES